MMISIHSILGDIKDKQEKTMPGTKKMALLTTSVLILSACVTTGGTFSQPQNPDLWTAYQADSIENVHRDTLKQWWEKFEDPTLTMLVETTLAQSPDRAIAMARIQEARGLRRTTRSSLFPQIGGSASIGEQDTGSANGDFYDAGFDASFEIDVFGVNRNAVNAADARVNALQAEYHDLSLTLIAEVARTYIEMRQGQKQVAIARKNLDIQQKTLELVKLQRDVGEAPELDVVRAETIVNTTRASISEFQRVADNARLRMTVLTGELPQSLLQKIDEGDESLNVKDIKPVLMAPSAVLASRPDILAASHSLMESTSLRESAFATLFPSFSVSGFYGISDTVTSGSTNIWSVALGMAVSLIDFGRIEGQIDAASARETIAFETYRKTVLEAIVEVETALNDYARINDRYVALDRAYRNANDAFRLSRALYREGETSFIDLLDAQRTLNDSESALITAEAAKIQAAIRVYKSLGVY
jgi:NodT family efflux transporter outer membrane factor (OMF) lipoprotein